MSNRPSACFIDGFGKRSWFKDGKLHRDDDLPARVFVTDGRKEWYIHGKLHRDGDKPAIVEGFNQAWFKYGKLHRDGDKPAIVDVVGDFIWSVGGKRHRDIGPACLDPPKFYEHGVERRLESIRGETLVGYSGASWSPVLCFI